MNVLFIETSNDGVGHADIEISDGNRDVIDDAHVSDNFTIYYNVNLRGRLSFCYRIPEWLRLAHDAGARGEELEIEEQHMRRYSGQREKNGHEPSASYESHYESTDDSEDVNNNKIFEVFVNKSALSDDGKGILQVLMIYPDGLVKSFWIDDYEEDQLNMTLDGSLSFFRHIPEWINGAYLAGLNGRKFKLACEGISHNLDAYSVFDDDGPDESI